MGNRACRAHRGRNVWHILPYEQLLKVLDMTADQLAVVLKEDFLFVKVNEFKPAAAPVYPTALTAEKTSRPDQTIPL